MQAIPVADAPAGERPHVMPVSGGRVTIKSAHSPKQSSPSKTCSPAKPSTETQQPDTCTSLSREPEARPQTQLSGHESGCRTHLQQPCAKDQPMLQTAPAMPDAAAALCHQSEANAEAQPGSSSNAGGQKGRASSNGTSQCRRDHLGADHDAPQLIGQAEILAAGRGPTVQVHDKCSQRPSAGQEAIGSELTGPRQPGPQQACFDIFTWQPKAVQERKAQLLGMAAQQMLPEDVNRNHRASLVGAGCVACA